MGPESFVYKLFFLFHLTAVIVGFGSSFVYPMLASKGRGLPPKESYAITHAVMGVSTFITTIPIYVAIACGLALVGISDKTWTFSQQWVSIACVLSLIAVLVAGFLHVPNLKAMEKLQDTLANGTPTPSKEGPPKEVLELQQRGPKAGMYGGILHLMFLLLVIDMIWKPGT